MKLSIVLSICALIAHAFAASIDVYDGATYNIDEAAAGVAESDIDGGSRADDLSPEMEEPSAIGHARPRRFTCDVLSFQSKWLSPNHSACAVRCVAQRRRGGRCKNGVCLCRGKKWGK